MAPITTNPQSPIPNPQLYACLYQPPAGDQPAERAGTLACVAREFSPRFECHGPDLVAIDISGLDRLIGPPATIGEELRRAIAARGIRAHVAIAATQTAALVVALARPGVTIVARGEEADALAPIHIGVLEKVAAAEEPQPPSRQGRFGEPRRIPPSGGGRPQIAQHAFVQKDSAVAAHSAVSALLPAIAAFKRWGLKTLGELAALPPADLVARMGKHAVAWQATARGEDTRPLIPTLDEERFDATLELEWPIEELEPLSFVLTRLLEPLSTRLERRDRGAAVLHVLLRLVTREVYARRLELPTPMRDVRTLRTLALLDLESHPPGAGIDRVTIVIDPTPGRVVQHTLFTRAQPTPEQVSTLLARLGALMGADRFGAPAVVDSYRPGAFAMTPFTTDPDGRLNRGEREDRRENCGHDVTSALRRCRQPVPARVAVADGRPVRVTTDRRGFAGGAVTRCAGPWRTSGEWWSDRSGGSGRSGESGRSESPRASDTESPTRLACQTRPTCQTPWNRDEWDVALSDGAVYRVFRDRDTDAWFIDAIVD
jgi:protein ImuB